MNQQVQAQFPHCGLCPIPSIVGGVQEAANKCLIDVSILPKINKSLFLEYENLANRIKELYYLGI